ncbi:UDP-glycosyltransferase UGT5 isoform X2 [Plutella xylostella]|nr:UDP-glycosyltransferase UGT5 isoform X2 [Plutella xylostella]
MKALTTTLLLCLLYTANEAAKILYVMPFTAASHYISQKDLAMELAKRGHDVYAITSHKEVDPPTTYHQIMVERKSVWDAFFTEEEKPNIFSMLDLSFAQFQNLMYVIGKFNNDLVFNSTEVQTFLKEDHKFDLVINELFFQESLYMFAHKYQAPLVLVTTFGNSVKGNFYGRNPLQLATVYHEYGVSPDPLSFIGRLSNFYYALYDLFVTKFFYMPELEALAQHHFKDLSQPLPSLEQLAANASLVLMNSHFSIDTPTAYLPNYIEVGGLNHPKEPKPLPKDLQKILDSAKNGVVYLSFGSNVQSKDLSKDRLEGFLKVFGELKETVLMKWEDDSVPNIPKNVVLRKWFPQKDVLAHPNIKLFIGHGGLLGLQETIVAGVPILGVPVFGDQYLNILATVQNGHGELLEYKNINEENLRTVINKMLTNKRYKEKALEVSIRFKDRPMNGIDTAVWWIEYVIRYKGADFIKTPALKLGFIQYHMLDVYLFSVVLLLVPFIVLSKILSLFKSKKTQLVEKKKQKKK